MRLAGWGRFPQADCAVLDCRDEAEAVAILRRTPDLIARGAGRAYGDAALNPQATVLMRRCDRLRAFDPATGLLTCDAGVPLADLIDLFVPRGWFPPVVPGTRMATVGGMIAADVHGKNHHRVGSFGRHVEGLRLLVADGSVVDCGPGRNAELFRATVGGMGLTGVIVNAAFRLMRLDTAFVRQKTIACPDIDSLMAAFAQADGWSYSVAWIDGVARRGALGRGLLTLGEHAAPAELPPARRATPLARPIRRAPSLPFGCPGGALNHATISAFNGFYHRRGAARTEDEIVGLDAFFHPLDALGHWNRIYGRRGFVQHQCVLPRGEEAALRRVLAMVAEAGAAPPLAVLKLFGASAPDAGLLSFPRDGFTLALDFPVSPGVFSLLDRVDRVVADHGGRLYLAKDARADAGVIAAGYPTLAPFRATRAASGADARFSSLLSRRLRL